MKGGERGEGLRGIEGGSTKGGGGVREGGISEERDGEGGK